mmetsp:Transcript_28225/g.86237  ORF Transcript_28225/g.86237 Transcript_28225/m.86237 type:complete len:210 (+) Transcript_28225:174-803(+)
MRTVSRKKGRTAGGQERRANIGKKWARRPRRRNATCIGGLGPIDRPFVGFLVYCGIVVRPNRVGHIALDFHASSLHLLDNGLLASADVVTRASRFFLNGSGVTHVAICVCLAVAARAGTNFLVSSASILSPLLGRQNQPNPIQVSLRTLTTGADCIAPSYSAFARAASTLRALACRSASCQRRSETRLRRSTLFRRNDSSPRMSPRPLK